ncbi:hypothetical protein KM043_018426 [Ampulex compressa]|nr:hypothetical protein KM043_018426 [Ampulex compressa]
MQREIHRCPRYSNETWISRKHYVTPVEIPAEHGYPARNVSFSTRSRQSLDIQQGTRHSCRDFGGRWASNEEHRIIANGMLMEVGYSARNASLSRKILTELGYSARGASSSTRSSSTTGPLKDTIVEIFFESRSSFRNEG